MAKASIDDLTRVPLFAELEGRQLRKLAGLFRERTVKPGTKIVEEGLMSGISFFVVAEGEAIVSVGGNEVAVLGAGDHFGELALITESERTASVTAKTEVRLLEIPFWDFREFAHSNPDVTWKLLQHVVALLQKS